MKNILLLLLISLMLGACTTISSPLERALAMAGENRSELERVIAHYDCERGIARIISIN